MTWRGAWNHNLGLKVLSLFLATLLWLFVTAGQESELDLQVPVLFEHLSSGLTIVNQPPSRLDVRVAGPKILLMRLRTDRLAAILDLKDAGEGSAGFPGPEKAIRFPEGVRVTRVIPAVIEVRLAKK
jgi:YbbR domain-containing protein